MVNFSLVVAVDSNNGMGRAGALPWHLPGDMKHFKEITTRTESPDKKNVVVMGRKTWESLPGKFQPLPERINVIMTRQEDFSEDDVIVVKSFAGLWKTLDEIFRK